jgi:leucyl-tRNA synthetase
MWERLGHKKSLAGHPWPSFDDSALKENVVTVVLQVNGKKRALMDVDVGISQDDLKAATIAKLDSTEYKVTANDQFIMVYQSGTTAPRLVNVLKKS